MDYINQVGSRNGIVPPTTFGFQHFSQKTGFGVRAIIDQSYFALPVLHKISHHLFAWIFYHFTWFPIVHISDYYYYKCFSIYSWGKSFGPSGDKVKDKNNNTIR